MTVTYISGLIPKSLYMEGLLLYLDQDRTLVRERHEARQHVSWEIKMEHSG